MVQCEYCGTEIDATMPFTCNECDGTFCPDHRLPESHWCTELRRSENTWSTATSGDDDPPERSGPEPMDTSAIPSYRSGDDGETGDPSPDVNPDGSIAGIEPSDGPVPGSRSWSLGMSPRRKRQVMRWGKRLAYLVVAVVVIGGLVVAFTPVALTDYWQTQTAADIDGFLNNSSEDLESLAGDVLGESSDSVSPTVTPQTPGGRSDEVVSGLNTSRIEQLLHDRINEIRMERGLQPVAWDTRLHDIAAYHSRDMAEDGYFAHESPGGETVTDRYNRFGYDCRAETGDGRYATGAENIAWLQSGPLFQTESEIANRFAEGWMNSPGHRENILRPYWDDEGIGVYVVEHDGDTRVYATQNFC